ncbi:MAG: SAF domain-containing protein [Acidimicrobiales bacterium]
MLSEANGLTLYSSRRVMQPKDLAMADQRTAPDVSGSARRSNGSGSTRPSREVRPQRRLPGGRAVVGGFLMAASAVGIFAAYTAASTGPDGSYAVVTVDVAVGQRLTPAVLDVVPLDLGVDQRRVAFGGDIGALDGATALAPLVAGQLVQTSDVAKPAGGPDRAQISVAVDPGNALGGDLGLLGSGERVAVIVTYTQGGAPETATVSSDATIVRVLDGSERVGGGAGLTVVLAVPPGELEPIAQAAAAGVVSIARTTGLGPATGGR